MRLATIILLASLVITPCMAEPAFKLEINAPRPRPFLAPQLWSNGFEHWSAEGDAIFASSGGRLRLRTAHLLNAEIQTADEDGAFEATVELATEAGARSGLQGLMIAAGEGLLDYKAASLVQGTPGRGGGFLAVVDYDQPSLVIADFGSTERSYDAVTIADQAISGELPPGPMTLHVHVERHADKARLIASLLDPSGEPIAQTHADLPADRVAGNVALASDFRNRPAEGMRHAFRDLTLGGSMITFDNQRTFGPLAGVLYSLSHPTPDAEPVLRIGVQALPFGESFQIVKPQKQSGQAIVELASRPLGSQAPFQPLGHPTAIADPSYYAMFEFTGWDASSAREIQVRLRTRDGLNDEMRITVQAEPGGDAPIRVAGVSCMGLNGRTIFGAPKPREGMELIGRWTPANVWFPFAGVVSRLAELKPDYVFYTGDQIYEGKPYPPPSFEQDILLDYHYRLALWHWAFGQINRRTNTVLQTDDHDVYQGNFWGDGGRLATEGWTWNGGYLRPAEDVNLVIRTMCSHNPPPWHADGLTSGIRNYFTIFRYGGTDFAVLEDRKFKAAPDPTFRQAPEDQLLGPAQLKMLAGWAAWPHDRPRVVVSQTIYANIQTDTKTGEMRPDRDANGWPVAGRTRAVEAFAKAGAVLLTGDQHLGTLAALETTTDPSRVYQFCTPAVGTVYWRWFCPDGQQHPRGPYADAFGNRFEIFAVANPMPVERLQQVGNNFDGHVPPDHDAVHRRGNAGDGVGAIRIDPTDHSLTFECWPWDGSDTQHHGWPHRISFQDVLGEPQQASP